MHAHVSLNYLLCVTIIRTLGGLSCTISTLSTSIVQGNMDMANKHACQQWGLHYSGQAPHLVLVVPHGCCCLCCCHRCPGWAGAFLPVWTKGRDGRLAAQVCTCGKLMFGLGVIGTTYQPLH